MEERPHQAPRQAEGYIELQRRIARQISPLRFFGWFAGLAIPFTLALSAFIAWHDSVVNPAQPHHLLLRLAIGAAGYLAILVVVYVQAIRPATRKVQENSERIS